MAKIKWVKVECPRCNRQGKVPIQHTGNKWPVDDAKCSRCFNDDLVFVNLVRIIPVPEISLATEKD